MLLWQGLPMELSNGMQVFVRAALICVGCDIPAARKVCGFVGHRALKGALSACTLFLQLNLVRKGTTLTLTEVAGSLAQTIFTRMLPASISNVIRVQSSML